MVLALTFVRGLLYLALMPPWQHYDEPTHFEYVRLIAERKHLPQPGDYDLEMRRQIAASMRAADFWQSQPPPIDFWSDQPPEIGISELQHPPLYYTLLALPQLLVTYQEVETQLYLARLGSVGLYLVVVAAAYGLAREALPGRRWLPLGVATFIAFLPPFTDLMSGVNNDVGAAAATSLLLWAAARLVRRGWSLRRGAGIVLLVLVCLFTKSTAGLVAVAILLALGVMAVPSTLRRWAGIGLAVLLLAALFGTLTWSEQAASWYSTAPAGGQNRLETNTPMGRSALVLSSESAGLSHHIFQELDRAQGRELRGQTVTLGAWLRAPAGAEGELDLILVDGLTTHSHRMPATADWCFHAFTATVSTEAPGLAVHALLPKRAGAAQRGYIDGLILAEGTMPLDQAPVFDTVQAKAARWGSRSVTNLLRNGSAESTWPVLRPWIGSVEVYRTPLAHIFHSLWEWRRTAWVYGFEFTILFQSFWGRFGWNHLALPGAYFYPLALLTLAGLAGSGLALVRALRARGAAKPWRWRAWVLMGIMLLLAWGSAVLRVHPVLLTQNLFWPVARYASVAIVPTAAVLCFGWAKLVPRRWRREAAWLGLLGLILLDAVALGTVILPYYYA